MYYNCFMPFLIQTLGIIALIFNIIAFASRTRDRILFRQAIASAFFVVHFMLLGAITGAVMSVIVIIRNWVFEHKLTSAWAKHRYWLYVFMIVPVLALFISWQGMISLFPVVGTSVAVYGLWHNKPKSIRIWMLASTIIWTPYLFIMHSYPGIINQAIIAGATIFGMAEDRHWV